jgi:hypothetical protein
MSRVNATDHVDLANILGQDVHLQCPSVGTVCSINCDCVLHWPTAPSAVRGW